MIIPEKTSINYYELILTENCNLRCEYCFDSYYSDRCSGEKANMPIELIDPLANFVRQTHNPRGKVVFSFFGGEPLLNWPFITSFVDYAKNNFRFKYIFGINTNSTLLDSSKIDYMLENQFRIAVSLDGIPEAHNLNRVDANGNPSWNESVVHIPELVAKAHRHRMTINVEMVVTGNNYQYFAESYKFLQEMGCTVVVLFDTCSSLEEEFFNSLEQQMVQLFIGEKRTMPVIFYKKILNASFYEQPTFCFHPHKNVSIAPDGKLYFCHMFVPKMAKEPTDEYYGDIWQGYYNHDYVNLIEQRVTQFVKYNKECQGCIAKEWCKGGCLGAQYHSDRNYLTCNSNMCKLYQMLSRVGYRLRK